MQRRNFEEIGYNTYTVNPEAFSETLEEARATLTPFEFSRIIHTFIDITTDTDLPAILAILVENGANLEFKLEGRTPISLAASRKKIEAVKFLLDQHVEINKLENPPLCSAIENSHYKILEGLSLPITDLLLTKSADVNVLNHLGNTPLILAIERKCSLTVSQLINYGADISIKKHDLVDKEKYQTPLGIAYRLHAICKNDPRRDDREATITQHILDCLLEAAKEYLYKECANSTENGMIMYWTLRKRAFELADDYPDFSVKEKVSFPYELMTEKVIRPVFFRIQQEKDQRHAFEMGSAIRMHKSQNQSEVYTSAVNRFFKQTNGRDLVTHIFSYVHEVTPHIENVNKPNKR